ncbi:MAG: Hint domain-containing protein [Pseudomonadota bacterium]
MATHVIHGYSAADLTYDPHTGAFTLTSDFYGAEDRLRYEFTDNDAYLDGDKGSGAGFNDQSGTDEIGEDSNQTAQIYDADGDLVAGGRVYSEAYAVLEDDEGNRIYIDRIEIDGEKIGYLSSGPIEPGVAYRVVASENVDDQYGSGDDDDHHGGNTRDTRARYSEFYDVQASDGTQPPVCFASGTLVDTPSGARAVEDLRAGDAILSTDGRPLRIDHLIRHTATAMDMSRRPGHLPVRIETEGAPLEVSAQHRVRVRHPLCEILFGSAAVLVPALCLTVAPGARYGTSRTIHYHHIVCDGHQVLRAQGIACESFLIARACLPCLTASEGRALVRAIHRSGDPIPGAISGWSQREETVD